MMMVVVVVVMVMMMMMILLMGRQAANNLTTLWWRKALLHFTSLHLSLSLVDRWGTKDDRATTVLHSSLFSAFRRASPNFNPVHSDTLSSHLFFCLPLLLPPCTVLCRIIFASPVDLVLCPYNLSLRFFTVVRRSSEGPMACLILFPTFSFVT